MLFDSELSRDDFFMGVALDQARLASSLFEVPVGAVLVHGDVVVASAFNQTLTLSDPSAHAEMLVLRQACSLFENHRLPQTELFVTLEPCAMCAGALLHARVRRLVFGAFDKKTGVAGGVLSLFQQPLLNHQTHVRGGVRASESRYLLVDFFNSKRGK
jgi:tRNA(adenine34) deaminase